MVIAVVAACAVLAAGVLAVLAVHRSRRESERKLELVFERVSSHLEAISTSVEQAVARMVDAQRERSQPLSLDFDALVDALVAEAAARTGADAVVLRVEGPGGRLVLASLGAGTESELAERAFAPPDARPFRAATIDWTYSASGEADDEGFRSAIVAPLAPSTGIPGTLVAYSSTSHAFRTEHTSALHGLVAEFGTGLANARRFADVEARLLLDPTTGVASRRGYEVELGREVARAHRTGRPLSVVLVGINGTETATTRRQRERRPGRPTPHASHAKERHLVQTWRPRVRDPDARDEGVGRTRSDRTPSRRGEARAGREPDDDRGGARGVAARRARRGAGGSASKQP